MIPVVVVLSVVKVKPTLDSLTLLLLMDLVTTPASYLGTSTADPAHLTVVQLRRLRRLARPKLLSIRREGLPDASSNASRCLMRIP